MPAIKVASEMPTRSGVMSSFLGGCLGMADVSRRDANAHDLLLERLDSASQVCC
jgi:hypothetical protein